MSKLPATEISACELWITSTNYKPITVMKKWFSVLGLIAISFLLVSCGDSNLAYVKKAIRIMGRKGLYAEGPRWEAAKKEALAERPQTLEQAQHIVKQLLPIAGGKHSFFYSEAQKQENQTERAWEMPTVQLVEGGIAIIHLPHFLGSDKDTKRYVAAVCDNLPDSLSGVVIDLRGNDGGNQFAMLPTVLRFLPDDDFQRFEGRKSSSSLKKWIIAKVFGLPSGKEDHCPVAILTDGHTASAAEMVMISFRGLENARTFGQPTAGYLSGNELFPLPDGSMLALTTSRLISRTGEVFCDDPVDPDVLTDTPMEDALNWINGRI